MKTKYLKTTMMILILAIAGVTYFYYLSNKPSSQDATEKSVNDKEMARLTTIDLDKKYPESPKSVVELYMRISKMYYSSSADDKDLEKLAKQARKLFDDELKSKQTESEYVDAVKKVAKEYKDAGRKVTDYKLESASQINYQELEEKKYASILGLYYIREDSKLLNSYTRFTMRQDKDGKWKILYWELVNDSDVSE